MQPFIFDFERMRVYQKSLDFVDRVFGEYKKLDHEYKFSIGNNLIPAALSVANNIAEGNGKQSKKGKNRYFHFSSNCARECVSVFHVLKRQGILDDATYFQLRSHAREITSMLNTIIKPRFAAIESSRVFVSIFFLVSVIWFLVS